MLAELYTRMKSLTASKESVLEFPLKAFEMEVMSRVHGIENLFLFLICFWSSVSERFFFFAVFIDPHPCKGMTFLFY